MLPLDGPTRSTATRWPRWAASPPPRAPADCDFTQDPGGDLAALGEQLQTAPRAATSSTRAAARVQAAIGSTRLFYLLLAGDFAPEHPGRAAGRRLLGQRGDPAALLRLAALNESTGEPSPASEFSAAVYAATLCEESPLPWSRGAPFDDAPERAADAATKRGVGAFAPLGADGRGRRPTCSRCARAGPRRRAAPAVPGAAARRADADPRGRARPAHAARGRAARRRRSCRTRPTMTVPSTGHSTLGSDASDVHAQRDHALPQAAHAALDRAPSRRPPLVVDEPVPPSLSEVDG